MGISEKMGDVLGQAVEAKLLRLAYREEVQARTPAYTRTTPV